VRLFRPFLFTVVVEHSTISPATFTMQSPPSKKQRYRLTKSEDNDLPPLKRFKTTGEDFVLRQLTYHNDKMDTNDEIHESIELCPVTKALVDTEVYQRLRNIRQLGNAEYIYACANHNRFQHSLGVAFLAEKMCKTIKEEQPELGATDKDVLCVKLAGLLHDIGHGPFSHTFEAFRDHCLPKFLDANPDLQEEYKDCENLKPIPHWNHEQSSLLFIDAALEELGLQIDWNNLDKPLKQIGDGIDANSMRVFKPRKLNDTVLTSRDFIFIKECIFGKPLEGFNYFVGRRDKKVEWLYDIVCNRHNGLDVDKIDYFARDHTRAMGKRGIFMKMITDARIAKGRCSRPEKCATCKDKENPGMHYMICYPEKHIVTTMHFFQQRMFLHNFVYQHKTTTVAESMICDILCLADPYLRLQSHSGEKFPMSRAHLKSDFLVRLDDSIITLIAHTTDERLAEARAVCRRLKRRDFYKCAVDQTLDIDRVIGDMDDLEEEEMEKAKNSQRDVSVWKMTETEIHSSILQEGMFWAEQNDSDSTAKLQGKDFIVKKYCMHHGAGANNPLLRMRFYGKMSEEKIFGPVDELPVAEQVKEWRYSSFIPIEHQKVGIRVLVREACKRGIVNQFFHQWYNNRIKNEDAPDQCGESICGLEVDEGDGNEDWNGQARNEPVLLSQDFDESTEETDDDRSRNERDPLELSPVPVRALTR